MKKLLYCENRNMFLKSETDIMTFWTKNNFEAKVFENLDIAKESINGLKNEIADSLFIIPVNIDFEIYS